MTALFLNKKILPAAPISCRILPISPPFNFIKGFIFSFTLSSTPGSGQLRQGQGPDLGHGQGLGQGQSVNLGIFVVVVHHGHGGNILCACRSATELPSGRSAFITAPLTARTWHGTNRPKTLLLVTPLWQKHIMASKIKHVASTLHNFYQLKNKGGVMSNLHSVLNYLWCSHRIWGTWN